ncbi:hypothetical protein [Amycolatopsis sp. cmx-4-61]|uniref:hypothetical protein n=1 Tax=Amycolatopsis sp. cmx-4-61 TaxID=2790937 RepID=UPI003979DAC1
MMVRRLFGVLAAGIIAASAAANPYGDPNPVSMFDGSDLTAWTSSKTGLWSAETASSTATAPRAVPLYYNKQQVGTFRWIFNVRQSRATTNRPR